ncbi:MAG: cytochrome-c peroxidase [Acidobacteria bacterium]|nr:cytochrome-c peroxidase [Acidobacteriota bacterium]
MKTTSLLFVICLVVAALVCTTGCATKPAKVEVAQAKLAMFKPLPVEMTSDANPITAEKIALGRMLYYEPRLSKSQKISCNSCHMLDKYGVDNQPTSDGHKGQKGDRNSPTVYNAAGQFVQFWDGRAANVEEQAKGPVLNPVEMAMPAEKQVVAVIKSMPEYVVAFKAAFPKDKDPVTYGNMALAVGAFERKLVTPSRWDKFLAGDQTALSESEKAGFNLFVDSGCNACHMGAFVGGSMYQKLGVVKPYPDESDPGRAKVTKSEGDKMMFKVPALRNVEKTGPYFHNGKVATLDDAVAQMGEYELGKQLKPEEVKSIVAWLATLTGEIPADYIKPPALPKSTPKTPKPDMGD